MAALRRRDLPLEAGSDATSGAGRPVALRDAVRRLARRLAQERGFSMAEIVVALMLFEFVAAGLVGLLTSTSAATSLARQRTLAQQAALNQIESIRALPYDSIGVVDGNPPGSVAASASVVTGGLTATVSTQISYVDDPTPLSYTSHANYKKVVVTIFRTRDSRQLAQEETYVAPPIKASASNAAINAQVVDYGDNTPVPNVGITLSTGPSAPRNDTTDVSGSASFAGLTPNPVSGSQAYYDLSLSPPSGYVTLADTVSPAAAAHVQLSPGQTWTTALYLYQPSTIYVALRNADATPFAGPATVTVSYTRNAVLHSEDFAYAGSTLAVTTIEGVPLIPDLDYTVSVSGTGFYPDPLGSGSVTDNVPTDYPTDLTHTFTFDNAPLATTLDVTVNGDNDVACPNASVTVGGGPWSVALAGSTGAAGEPAAFGGAVPAGTPYTIQGTWNGHTAQLTGQTVSAATNAFVLTLGAGNPC